MKSDLVGRVKHSELKTATLYIDRRVGFVVLTSDDDPEVGTIVHTINSPFKLGTVIDFEDDEKDSLEVLGGTITLSNS